MKRVSDRELTLRLTLSRGVRRIGLIGVADCILSQYDRCRNFTLRRNFNNKYPDFVLPPASLAYGAYGPWEPKAYLRQGTTHAAYIAEIVKRHRPSPNVIAEWGCGPVRVLRHLPNHFAPAPRIIVLDFNPKTIAWCRRYFRDIEFLQNEFSPPLPFFNGEVAVIYAISVFNTSFETSSIRLCRGIDALHSFREESSSSVCMATESANGLGRESRKPMTGANLSSAIVPPRGFIAFHPPTFVRYRMFSDHEIIEHDITDRIEGFRHDHWVIRRTGKPLPIEATR
jgi:hypothetical protein